MRCESSIFQQTPIPRSSSQGFPEDFSIHTPKYCHIQSIWLLPPNQKSKLVPGYMRICLDLERRRRIHAKNFILWTLARIGILLIYHNLLLFLSCNLSFLNSTHNSKIKMCWHVKAKRVMWQLIDGHSTGFFSSLFATRLKRTIL